jgi:hypothetical protein
MHRTKGIFSQNDGAEFDICALLEREAFIPCGLCLQGSSFPYLTQGDSKRSEGIKAQRTEWIGNEATKMNRHKKWDISKSKLTNC